jgi:hypothetical protein
LDPSAFAQFREGVWQRQTCFEGFAFGERIGVADVMSLRERKRAIPVRASAPVGRQALCLPPYIASETLIATGFRQCFRWRNRLGTLIGVGLLDEPLAALDDRIAQREADLSRPEAVRRLVEIGLTVKSRPKQISTGRARKADAMAGKHLDRVADQSASADERASRKIDLFKGPEEFRGVRIDRVKPK